MIYQRKQNNDTKFTEKISTTKKTSSAGKKC